MWDSEEKKKGMPDLMNSGLMGSVTAPQRYALNKLAGMLGAQGNPENSEETSQNIVENVADRMGIPADSTIGNAAKAAGVAGLEVFGDPVGMFPAGRVLKTAEQVPKIAKAVEKFPEVAKLFQVGGQAFNARNTEEALRVKKALEEAGHVPAGRPLQILTEGNPFDFKK